MSSPRILSVLNSFRALYLVPFVALWLLVASRAPGVVNGVPVPNSDRRFDAVGMFIRDDYQGICGGWTSGTCTLIAPNMVLIARHCLDITTADPLWTPQQRQYKVRFRRTVDGTSQNSYMLNGARCHGQYQEIPVLFMVDAQNPGCDQVLGYLAAVPEGIEPISPMLSNPPLHPIDAILAGWGYAGDCFAQGDHWGLNYAHGRLPDNWTGNDYLAFSYCTLGTTEPCLTCPSFGGPFMTANLHDSGAPVLMEVPSTDPTDPTPELRLIGTVSSFSAARRPSAWNNAGGRPEIVESQRVTHIRVGDFDGNGVLTVNDLLRFLDAFIAGRMDADADQSGALDVNDVFYFVHNWFN